MAQLYTPQQQTAIKYFDKFGIPIDEGLANLDNIINKKILIKIGGDCFNKNGYDLIGRNLADLYSMGLVPTILHGGGPQIGRIMEERGLQIVKVNGLRKVPDTPTLDAVVDGLKEVNNGLVNSINQYAGSNIAIGLMDEKIVYAEKHPPVLDKETNKLVDLGFVGVVTGIDNDKIEHYIKQGKIPVIWCIGYGKDGQQHNINADMVGEAFAADYDKYILLTSIGGYLENDKIVTEMTLEQAKKHTAKDGMSIKLDHSVIRVLENTDLNSVQISSPGNLAFELFTDKGKGTMITKQKELIKVNSRHELLGLERGSRVTSDVVVERIKEGKLYVWYEDDGGNNKPFGWMSPGAALLSGNFREGDLVTITGKYNPSGFFLLEKCVHQTSIKFSELPQ